jgi:hypothetical protein
MSAFADLQRTHRVLEGVRHFRELPTVQTTASHAYHVAQRHRDVNRAILSILTERTTADKLLEYIEEKATASRSPSAKTRCCICLKKERTHACAPCGHYKYCGHCIEKIKLCAICRRRVVHRIKIYE